MSAQPLDKPIEIRDAVLDDIPGLVALAREAYAKSSWIKVEPVETDFMAVMRRLIADSRYCLFVAVKDGQVVGALAGLSDELFYSRKKYATDLWFYVSEEGKGSGVWLLKRFINWAKRPGVVEISVAISSGIDESRTGKLYERIGLEPVGTIYGVKL